MRTYHADFRIEFQADNDENAQNMVNVFLGQELGAKMRITGICLFIKNGSYVLRKAQGG